MARASSTTVMWLVRCTTVCSAAPASAAKAADLRAQYEEAVNGGGIPLYRGSVDQGRFLDGQDTSAYAAPATLLDPPLASRHHLYQVLSLPRPHMTLIRIARQTPAMMPGLRKIARLL